MNKNVKIAKQLVKLAKSLIALDEEGDGSGFQLLHDYDNFEQEELDRAEKEGKKYIPYKKEHKGLWRIRACKDFHDVKKGDFGGFVQNEYNLSHEGNCWIYDRAEVWDNARVYDNAQVREEATIYGNARIYGNATVSYNATVYDRAEVYGNATVFGHARVCGDAKICGNADVSGTTKVCEHAMVNDYQVTKGIIIK